ncbi:hypothetical protein D7V94_07160 [Parablautia intestinalis]|uniref:Uncharacterized protein n=1 Tax=Parablautia intestinalis TaxID=2320100 RepID=A0A3A9ALH8_9FIRM|nr:hypothetical protein [Parablautia intestinalis]RKI92440.1 hypothetical protein D7V94_07160 [Parablautia intestinalis]
MKKRGMAVLLIFMLLCTGGCGKEDESRAEVIQSERLETEENNRKYSDEKNPTENAERDNGTEDAPGENQNGENQSVSIEGMIKEQSFEVELEGWGKVFFVSIAPKSDNEHPRFALVREGEEVYTFPKTSETTGDKFVEVNAVSFQDYNQDGKKDVIVLVTYGNGENTWKEAEIFLQENSDNMFYLDYPDLAGYRVEGADGAGPGFYRDTLLEEYLGTQRLTETVAQIAPTWPDYIDYVDGLSGYFSEKQQMKRFAEEKDVWAKDVEFADDRHCFTLASMGYDGKVTLIVSNQGGTGCCTYSSFYQIDDRGEVKKLETSFKEGDSEPDLIMDNMTVYSSFSIEGNRNYFIVYDQLKDSPDSYVYRAGSLYVEGGYVQEIPLASQRVLYAGEDYSAHITSYDCNGNELTEEEYDNFPFFYYEGMGLTGKSAVFEWMDVKDIQEMDDAETEKALRQVYEKFSIKEN